MSPTVTARRDPFSAWFSRQAAERTIEARNSGSPVGRPDFATDKDDRYPVAGDVGSAIVDRSSADCADVDDRGYAEAGGTVRVNPPK